MPKGGKKGGGKKGKKGGGKKLGKNRASIAGRSDLPKPANGALLDSGSVLLPKPLPPNIPLLGENLLHVLKTHQVDDKELHNMRIGVRALDELTPQEIRDLKLVFDVFDSDLDGNLTLPEVRLALRALGFKTDLEQVEKMATELNKGLTITDFNAFLNFVIDRQGESRDLHDEITLAFKYFDLDGTGKVTASNLKQLCRDYRVRIPDAELEEMIQEADTNGDNAVDVDEFVRVMLQTHLYS